MTAQAADLALASVRSDMNGGLPSAGGTPPGAWFSGLRSRITAALSMSDWLTQLGITKTRAEMQANGQQHAHTLRPQSSVQHHDHHLPPVTQWRSSSVDPMECADYENVNVMFDAVTLSPIVSPIEEHSGQLPPMDEANWQLATECMAPGRNYQDTLQLQHFGPLADLVPLHPHMGDGHDFQTLRLVNPTWCDKCGDFIVGFVKQALRCHNCNYTCHYKCRALITLDCRTLNEQALSSDEAPFTYSTAKSDLFTQYGQLLADDHNELLSNMGTEPTPAELPEPIDTSVIVTDVSTKCPHGDLLRQCIKDYNEQETSGLGLTLNDDGLMFSGYLQVHMNFSRPINVVAGQTPPTVYDVITENGTSTSSTAGRRTISSFYLPRNTCKTLHLDSETTTRQMIVSLLKKFKIADNPRKFALYERRLSHVDADTLIAKLCRVSDDCYPLRLALHWGANSGRRFVLQENETGDVLWEAFEIPELNNFLKILELEEQQYLWQIRQRYNVYRHRVQLELRGRGLGTVGPSLNQNNPFDESGHADDDDRPSTPTAANRNNTDFPDDRNESDIFGSGTVTTHSTLKEPAMMTYTSHYEHTL